MRNKIKVKVSVVGQGYVGFPTALLLAENSYDVMGVDINHNLINSLNDESILKEKNFEPDVLKLYKKVIKTKKILFSKKLTKSKVFIICVPTPIKKNNKSDISYVNSAVDQVVKVLSKDDILIIESTISIGSIESIRNRIDRKIKKQNKKIFKYFLSYCPERVLPGASLKEILNNDKIIGGYDEESSDKTYSFYKSFLKGMIYKTNYKIAEIVKLAENASRDLNIAFANELGIICDNFSVDKHKVIELANKHPRVNILKPGIGVGGHCIPIDPYFLIEKYKNKNSIIRMSRTVNDYKTEYTSKKILKIITNLDFKKPILFLGLSYKENIGDYRESPAIKIISSFAAKYKKKIYISDPFLGEEKIKINKDSYKINLSDGLNKCGPIFILVNHSAYNNIGKKLSNENILFNCHNII